MSRCVLACSVALAWVLPRESLAGADRLLREVAVDGATVPTLFSIEVANVLLTAQRRKRISAAERQDAVRLLGGLPLSVVADSRDRLWSGTMMLADAHGLTIYDAIYLDLALTMGLPLATADDTLRRAARSSGVVVIP